MISHIITARRDILDRVIAHDMWFPQIGLHQQLSLRRSHESRMEYLAALRLHSISKSHHCSHVIVLIGRHASLIEISGSRAGFLTPGSACPVMIHVGLHLHSGKTAGRLTGRATRLAALTSHTSHGPIYGTLDTHALARARFPGASLLRRWCLKFHATRHWRSDKRSQLA